MPPVLPVSTSSSKYANRSGVIKAFNILLVSLEMAREFFGMSKYKHLLSSKIFGRHTVEPEMCTNWRKLMPQELRGIKFQPLFVLFFIIMPFFM